MRRLLASILDEIPISRTIEETGMYISKSAWQQVQSEFLEDLLSLWLPPVEPFAIDPNFPKSSSMEALVKEHSGNIRVPEKTLVCVHDSLGNYPVKLDLQMIGDWATLFEFDLLQGFGHSLSSEMKGPTFEGLKQLATTWGLYLANKMKASILRWEVISALGVFLADMWVELFRKIPSKELGDAVRGSITPAYIRAGATVRYSLALLDGNERELRETLDILRASDADLNREINYLLHRHPAEETGRELQQKVVETASFLKHILSNDRFAEELQAALPASFRLTSWFVGHRLKQNMEYDPEKVKALLEAVNSHREIGAAMEQYRYKYAWQGDRNNAIVLAWQALAPKYFRLSPNIEDIHEDGDLERLIGMQQGLERYVGKKPAIRALRDGLRGRLGAYLKRAAKNERIDYIRKQTSKRNKVQTMGKHVSDLRSADEEEDEILSRRKEKLHPSRDGVVEELESKETFSRWLSLLTESEKTATTLRSDGYKQAKIARIMGISQQRVSQLLASAWTKYLKIKNPSLSP
jgi:RNA polymerase sigma factor (sigma-70 family)